MRILFTTIAASGHFHPLVPLARAAEAAGHEVAFATGGSFCPAIQAAGFRCFSAGFDYGGQPLDAWFPEMRELTGEAFVQFVARRIRIEAQAKRMVPDLLTLAEAWPPDLIVRDAAEYGGCVAAEVLGIPHASVRTAYSPSCFVRRLMIASELTALRTAHGLPPDPEVKMPFRYLHLAAEPPGFWPAEEPPAPTSHLLRPLIFDDPGEALVPDWVERLPAVPTVCATLGTFMNRSTDVFAAIIAGVRDHDVNLVVLIGRNMDPAQFDPHPANVHVEQYIPLSRLLPYADLVISQAGFSTITTTLRNGLPMVLIPLGADQPENARQCAALGVGLVVAADERTSEGIGRAMQAVWVEPRYRANAERVRDAMAALPGTEHAVCLLDRLAADKRPLWAA